MDWSFIERPLDRILYWIESGFKSAVKEAEKNRQKNALLHEFEHSSTYFLTLGRLTAALGLSPPNPAHLETTRKLLVRLPPPGPARPDTTPGNREKPEADQLWGIPVIMERKKKLLEAFEASSRDWLTLGRLTGRVLGLDPSKQADLETTRKLLVRLPPPGPARPDTTPGNREKPEADQLWGLTSVVGKGSGN
jgi:hypothetical protein